MKSKKYPQDGHSQGVTEILTGSTQCGKANTRI
jgi:hypothetical protein